MAIQRERLNRKNASGEYDTIHLETQADLVLMVSDPSKNVEQVLGETVAIAKGGTGGTTAAAGLYNLMAGLMEMTAEELAEDDLLCVLDVDANSAKKIALSVIGIGGGTTNPDLPDKGSLTLGNTVTFAGKQWIVSHVTSTEAYLTFKGLSGNSLWTNLQSACTTFANSLTEAQKECLLSVTAGNTSGKVFVATKDQMDGGFSYFNSDSRRRLNDAYWTSSTEYASVDTWFVRSDGGFGYGNYKSDSYGFRPSVCIDMSLYDSEGGGSEEPVTNPNWPNKSDLVVGNVINWAGHDWIVSHIAVSDQDVSNIKPVEVYLTLKELDSIVTFGYDTELDKSCSRWQSRTFTSEQLSCLKEITAGVTSGKVFVATAEQMNGGFSYFNSDARRIVSNYDSFESGDGYYYWTSTEDDGLDASYVRSETGKLGTGRAKWLQSGFRPSVCIDLTLYNQ